MRRKGTALKIRVPQSAITGEVAALSGSILSASSASPGSLPGIRLSATDGKLSLAAYNARDHAEFSVPAEIDEEGSVVVAADKAFPALVSSLAGQDLVIQADRGGSVLRIEAKGSEFSIPTLVATDWPEFPESGEATAQATLPTGPFLKGIQRAAKAAANNDAKRPIFEGMLLEVSETGVVLSATDSHRISVRHVPAQDIEGSGGCIVHSRSLDVLSKMAKLLTAEATVRMCVEGSRRISFEQAGRFRLSCAVMGDSGKYPNLGNVVPKAYAVDAVFDRRELLAAHRRAALFVGDVYSNPLILTISDLGVLELSADRSSATVGTAKETLAAVDVLSFEPDESYRIGLNSRFLADGLGLVGGDSVRLRCTAQGTQTALLTEIEADPQAGGDFYLAVAVRI